MNDNPSDNVEPVDEELVAYLDGELDAESSRRIEGLLASDPEIRRRLQSFERTWELLDDLDAAPLGEPFTQTTLEMVAVAARQDAEQSRADAPRRRRRRLLVVGGIMLAAAAVGFLAVAQYNPDRQLLHDLPVLENLDEYHQIGSIEFLYRLRDERLFSHDVADPPKYPAADEENTASRRQRIANMSLDEKEQLLRIEDRFTAWAPEEQERLRRLHQDLQNASDGEQLRAIMHSYYEWLKPLPSLTWEELADMKPSERVASVKKRLQEEQQREGGKRPGGSDMAAVRRWMDDCATQHAADFKKTLKTEKERERFSEMGKPLQHRIVFGYLRQRWLAPSSDKLPPMMTTEDLARLREKLSLETQKRLEDKPPVEQWRLVAAWMRQETWRPGEDRRMRGPLSKNDDERLAEFFEKVLSDEDRDRLLAMPGEEMQWELQRWFLMRTRPLDVPGRRPEGVRRGRWQGDVDRAAPGSSGPATPPPLHE